jgi:hypothetical protein
MPNVSRYSESGFLAASVSLTIGLAGLSRFWCINAE